MPNRGGIFPQLALTSVNHVEKQPQSV